MRLFKRKPQAPPGLKLLSDVSDEEILADIDRLYYTLIPAMDQLVRGSAVFLVSIQRPEGLPDGSENESWKELRSDILKGVRLLEQHSIKSQDQVGSGVAELMSLYYHAFMWGNTLNTVPQWRECMEKGMAMGDPKKGYDMRKDRGYT